MYFINGAHKENFASLLTDYGLNHRQNVEYEAGLYISALPEIYKCFNGLNNSFEGIPLTSLTSTKTETGEWIISHPRLTGVTKQMVAFGLSLYNGYPISLGALFDAVHDETYQKVLAEAMHIRTGKTKKLEITL